MGDARINLTPVLRPLPQLNFRLSQQPPASLRISRRQTSQTDSIDDDSFCESVDMDTIVDDFDAFEAEGEGKVTLDLDLRNLTPLTVSSPVLSLGSMASTNHRVARAPLSPIYSAKWQADANTPTRKTAESLLRKFVATPPLKHQRQTETSEIYTPSLARSPLRTLSSHRQHIRPQSAPVRRPLLSQRPSIPPPSQPSEQTPSKRPRRMGATTAEFLSIASREVSDFCTWSHCVGGESNAQLVCQRPLPDLRLNIHSIERVLSPHLFSACASVAQVRVGHGGHLLAGQPITVLLSFAVSLDATPQAAQQLIRQVSSLEVDSAAQPLAEDAADVIIAVYQPWRIRGEGEQMSLLASRFEIDHNRPVLD
ncbi:hypothetical protein IWW46_003730 [Coemansia sp. RSA 2440]|nr:hypothetical protein IWW46_003730 [Coemansia sp. RSA 2440]